MMSTDIFFIHLFEVADEFGVALRRVVLEPSTKLIESFPFFLLYAFQLLPSDLVLPLNILKMLHSNIISYYTIKLNLANELDWLAEKAISIEKEEDNFHQKDGDCHFLQEVPFLESLVIIEMVLLVAIRVLDLTDPTQYQYT
jgi:hypothetical protein